GEQGGGVDGQVVADVQDTGPEDGQDRDVGVQRVVARGEGLLDPVPVAGDDQRGEEDVGQVERPGPDALEPLDEPLAVEVQQPDDDDHDGDPDPHRQAQRAVEDLPGRRGHDRDDQDRQQDVDDVEQPVERAD